MKTKISILSALIVLFALFSGCEEENSGQTGTVKLSITDAPVDNDQITGVYITVDGLKYHKQDTGGSGWQTFDEYEGPKTFNLLELTDGMTAALGTFEMEAGQYNQLRFTMDIADKPAGTFNSSGCYLVKNETDTIPLFVPSGGQSGYKATGAFRVPSNGTVNLTADWDARKAVVKAGAGHYILRPTIRLIAEGEAGKINGSIKELPAEYSSIGVHAYEDDTYDNSTQTQATDSTNLFSDAVTSDVMGVDGGFQLNWLAPGTYDLVVVKNIGGDFDSVLGIKQDVALESDETKSITIDISDLSIQ